MTDSKNNNKYTNGKNHNPYMSRFLSMYSHGPNGNSGTRGYDDLTYVPTMLDERLSLHIKEGKFYLVCPTGNAGDGKTAFIRRIEIDVDMEGAKFEKQTSNGSVFIYKEKTFVTMYDGSQDEGDASSDDVLTNFFKDFEGDSAPNLEGRPIRLIAINEGRLLHFLSKYQFRYRWLYNEIIAQFEEGKLSQTAIIIVNLNNRCVVDGDILNYDNHNYYSIFDKIINNLLDIQFWNSCQLCDYAERCYVKFNTDSLRYNIIRQRFKLLFQTVHFSKKVHITVRYLKSVLSYIIMGTKDCADIQRDIGHNKKNLQFLYYNSCFKKNDVDNRLLKAISDLDVAEIANTFLDNRLNFDKPQEQQDLYLKIENRSNLDIDILSYLYDRRPDSIFEDNQEKKENAKMYHESIRRKYFFENRELSEKPELRMVPTQFVEEFSNFILGKIGGDKILEKIIIGLNRCEGIYNTENGKDSLYIKTTKNMSRVKAFYHFQTKDFDIRPKMSATQYIEYLPDSIEVIYKPKNITVDINLGLYEAIMHMMEGYTPSTAELKGFYQNIQIFKKKILGAGGDSVSIEDEGKIVKISKDSNDSVKLEV